MWRRYTIWSCLLSALSISQPALISRAEAEVYQCNGTYTDRPCGSSAPAKPETPPSAKILPPTVDNTDQKILSQKRSLIHELSMKAFEVSRAYKVRYDTTSIENFCLDKATSLEECQTRVDQMHERIDDRVASLQMVEEQKRANDLQQERNEIEANRQNQINIVQENNLIIYPRRRPHQSPYSPNTPYYRSESAVIPGSGGIISKRTPTVTLDDTNPIPRKGSKPSW